MIKIFSMKKTIIIIVALCVSVIAIAINNHAIGISTPESYEKLWADVKTAEDKNLPKTALNTVEKIYDKATADKNDYQQLKAVVYKTKYLNSTSENVFVESIAYVGEQAEKLSGTNKHICNYLLGALYQKYYQNNKYQIDQRSAISDSSEISSRLEFCDKATFVKLIISKYSLALNDNLKTISAKDYLEFMDVDSNLQPLDFFPTMYDQIAYAIARNLTEISSNIKLGDMFSCDADSFLDLKIEDWDSNPQTAIMNILQLAMKNNKTQNPEIFAMFDFLRLSQSYSSSYYGRVRNADDRNMQLIDQMSNKYSDYEAVIFINEYLARRYYDNGEPERLVEAVNLLEATIQKFGESKYIGDSKNLLKEIKQPSVNLSSEEIVYPNTAFPLNISYRNLEKINLIIVKLSSLASSELMNENDPKKYLSRNDKVVKTISLPAPGDYSEHHTQYVCEGLSDGGYFIFVKADSPDYSGEVISCLRLRVSKYCLVNVNDGEFKVLDRESGSPVAGAKVKIVNRNYDYRQRKYNVVTVANLVTDSNGSFFVEKEKLEYSSKAYISKDGREVCFEMSSWNYHNNNSPENKYIEIFTDRAIYRPGQTVKYNVIACSGSDNNYKVSQNQELKVTFRNANYKEIASQKLITNDFGSANGEFEIPSNVLTGNFSICVENDLNRFQESVRVEEYKRPTFEVEIFPPTDEVSFGDIVEVKGRAVSYSGVPLSNADVAFNVNCSSFSHWWRYGNNGESQFVAEGNVETDAQGNFSIKFVARECFNSINRFKIEARVSDINGETQIANTSLCVSLQSLWISTDIAENVERNSFNGFDIIAENIAGEKMPAIVNVEVHKLEEPERAFVESEFRTDKKMYSLDEWRKLCPNLEYDNEMSIESRKSLAVVFKSKVNTAESDKVKLNQKFAAGSYKIILRTKDKQGNEVADSSFFHVYDNSSLLMPYATALYANLTESEAEIGDVVNFRVGSSFNDVDLYYTIQNSTKNFVVKKIRLSNEIKDIEIPIAEDCYGNVNITAMFVRFGKVFHVQKTIAVERKNKQLDVNLVTFRDKTLPGAEESWQIRIADKNNNPAQAELMTTVYDASLDSYAKHSMQMLMYSSNYPVNNFVARGFGDLYGDYISSVTHKYCKSVSPYPNLSLFGALEYSYYSYSRVARAKGIMYNAVYEEVAVADMSMGMVTASKAANSRVTDDAIEEEAEEEEPNPAFDNVDLRTDFSETAFWYPNLTTDKEGNVFVNFTMPQSLTRWNVLGLAHTQDMKIGTFSQTLITQKQVSVTPNLPRFFREGDEVYISAKISNLTENELSGSAQIVFTDIETSKDITEKFTDENVARFSVDAENNTSVDWKINIPMSISAVSVKVVAVAGGHSDGEEKIVPILTNRIMVTETMTLPVRKSGTTDFSFESMKNNDSKTLENYSYTLEFTSNPAWYAVLSLPYMMEYPYECAEQTFSRLYANLLASHIVNSDPQIKNMFESWKNVDTETLKSNLNRNEELKNIILENTPWVLDAEKESENKQNVGTLFDLNRISNETQKAIDKLSKMQYPNGGFPWFEGMRPSLYVTQNIVGDYGHLKKLGVNFNDAALDNIVRKAIKYIDEEFVKAYNQQKINGEIVLGYSQIYYLYVRSFFMKDNPVSRSNQKIIDEYLNLAETKWKDNSLYMQGMIALSMQRLGRTSKTMDIVASLKEYAQHSEEMGMYWNFSRGYYWYNNGIETQSLLIELFDETNQITDVEEMKVWLLKQKQTQSWPTTKSTSKAVYSLLLRGADMLSKTDYPIITLGQKSIDLSKETIEEGTGYYKNSWTNTEMSKDWSNISVTKSDNSVAWGGVYWQYYENLENIKDFEDTPLKIRKSLFVNRVEKGKNVIRPISQKQSNLHVGDRVTVRIEIEADRNMEYIHLKDMRASAFEPVDKLSGYRFKNGLGYYEAIKDASINFFIDYLPKGTYVFEYQVVVTQKGKFSNGITTIQSMYAPEFTSHSKGEIIKVE